MKNLFPPHLFQSFNVLSTGEKRIVLRGEIQRGSEVQQSTPKPADRESPAARDIKNRFAQYEDIMNDPKRNERLKDWYKGLFQDTQKYLVDGNLIVNGIVLNPNTYDPESVGKIQDFLKLTRDHTVGPNFIRNVVAYLRKNPPTLDFSQRANALLARIPQGERTSFESVLPQLSQLAQAEQERFLANIQTRANTLEEAARRQATPKPVEQPATNVASATTMENGNGYVSVRSGENLRDPKTNAIVRRANAGETFQIVGDLPPIGKYQYKLVEGNGGERFKICVNDGQNVQIVQNPPPSESQSPALAGNVASATTMENGNGYVSVRSGENLRDPKTNAIVRRANAGETFQIVGDLPPIGKYQYKLVEGNGGERFKICVNDGQNVQIVQNPPPSESQSPALASEVNPSNAGRTESTTSPLNDDPRMVEQKSAEGVGKYLFNVDNSFTSRAFDGLASIGNSIIPDTQANIAGGNVSDGDLRGLNAAMQRIYDREKGLVDGTLGNAVNKMSGDEIDLGRTDFINQNSERLIKDTVAILEKNPNDPHQYAVYNRIYKFLIEQAGLHYANLFRSQCLSNPRITGSVLASQISQQRVPEIKQHSPNTVIWFNQKTQEIKIYQTVPDGKRMLIDSFDARGGNRTVANKTDDSGLHDATRTPDGVHGLYITPNSHTTERYRSAWIQGNADLKVENGVVFHNPKGTSRWLPATGEDAAFLIKGKVQRVDSLNIQLQVAGGKAQLEERMRKDGIAITGNIESDFRNWKQSHPNSLARFTTDDFKGLIDPNGKGRYENRNPFGDAPALALGNTGTFIHQKVLTALGGNRAYLHTLSSALGGPSVNPIQDLNAEYAAEGGAMFSSSHGCITTFDPNFDRMSAYVANGAKIIVTSTPEQERKYLG